MYTFSELKKKLKNDFSSQTPIRVALLADTATPILVQAIRATAGAGTVALIGALFGRVKKCLVLDLDNTLWGGVIGDDGIENLQLGNLGIGKAFTEFQYWIKKLKDRGIILAVCIFAS
jgi:predicted enzyme involved in methoxymalonyl-ACP biosynthesis